MSVGLLAVVLVSGAIAAYLRPRSEVAARNRDRTVMVAHTSIDTVALVDDQED